MLRIGQFPLVRGNLGNHPVHPGIHLLQLDLGLALGHVVGGLFLVFLGVFQLKSIDLYG